MPEKKKIFVIQFRTDETLEQDKKCIIESLEGIDVDIIFTNGALGEFPEHPEKAAAVIYGGSSEFFVGRGEKTDAWVPKAHTYLDELAEKDIPVIGLCYGAQFIGEHFGGRITEEEKYQEVGTYELTLTDAAKDDPVFSSVPEKFMMVTGHKETVVDLPENLIVLGSTERVESHALRVKGKKIWATLYHPEINKRQLIERLTSHPEYLDDPSELAKLNDRFADVPEAVTALRSFTKYAMEDFDKKYPTS